MVGLCLHYFMKEAIANMLTYDQFAALTPGTLFRFAQDKKGIVYMRTRGDGYAQLCHDGYTFVASDGTTHQTELRQYTKSQVFDVVLLCNHERGCVARYRQASTA